ncbi:MAG: type IX secretion system membrane protein PorP/SprF [Bacteroidales bacterium]|nr:type IX secretion system membrane protein PorP/SprF [Bacteroidales bacterium]
MLLSTKGLAQDPQFSQFYANYLYLGSSFAGLNEENRLAFNYRDQWPGISNGYETFSVSFDRFFHSFNSGIGAYLIQDVSGTGRLKYSYAGLVYSYDFRITESLHVRPGLSFSYLHAMLDFYRLTWGDQIMAEGTAPISGEISTYESMNDIDFGTSLLTYTENFWLGASVDHLLRPNQSLKKFEEDKDNLGLVPIKYQLYGGTKYLMKQSLLSPIPSSLQLAFLYKQQQKFTQLDAGLYGYKSPLVLGFWYRGIPLIKSDYNNDALVILVGYKVPHFSIGYSYDFYHFRA